MGFGDYPVNDYDSKEYMRMKPIRPLLTFFGILILLGAYVAVMGKSQLCPVCTAIVGYVSHSSAAPVAQTDTEWPMANRLLPIMNVPFEDLDGNIRSLSEYSGKPILIEVWATWCGPCRTVRSIFKKHASELQSVATVVGISVDRGGPAVVKSYLEKNPSPGVIEFMSNQDFLKILAPYDTANTIPKLIYLSPEGVIIDVDYGVPDPAFMVGMLGNMATSPSTGS